MRLFSLRFLLSALLALTLALLWGGASWITMRDRAQSIALEEARLQSLARAFSEHALASFQRADSILLSLRERWAEGPQAYVAELARHQKGLTDLAILVGVVDANGMVVYNNLDPAAKPTYSGDRHHFLAQKDAREDRLVISPPTLGRISGKWFVQLSRRLGGAGSFEGVVFVSVDPAYYARFYGSLRLGDGSSVAMVRDSGELMARHPYSPAMGSKLTGLPFLEQDPPSHGNFRRVSQTDNVDRLLGYVRLPDYGVTLTVSKSVESILAPVTEREWLTFAGAAIFSALFGLLFLLTYRGVIAREHAEAATRSLNIDLERRVRKRTAQLEAANKELEAFAYSVSHDLKAPLRGIDGYGHLLLDEFGAKLGDDGRAYIENMRRATRQMHALIDDMLAYARVERATLTPESLELQALVSTLLAEMAAHPGSPRSVVSSLVPALSVTADRNALAMALRNLIDNALKFTYRTPSPVIEVGARRENDGVVIWVKDNGPGFDMAFHDKIFDMFQRLNRAEDYAGTGIGLAIVRKAMERMGGRAWAHSEPGQGATFFLEVPK